MFKAKLIDGENYYSLRRKNLVFFFVTSAIGGALWGLGMASAYVIALIFTLYIAVFVYAILISKRMQSLLGNKLIEIDEKEIRIKSKNAKADEVININSADKLVVKETYMIPGDSGKEIRRELKGEARKNYLIFRKGKLNRQFDFEIDSYYMITQLENLIQQWEAKGLSVERV